MTRTINRLFIIAGTLTMLYVMSVTGRNLKTPDTPHGILDLEFAYNQPKVTEVISAWSVNGPEYLNNIDAAIRNTWLDFIFLFFYSFFLFSTCKSIAGYFSGVTQKTGYLLANAALFAGLLDIAENTGMLLSLNGIISNSIAMATTVFAVTKWFLALSPLLYILLLGPVILIRMLFNKQK